MRESKERVGEREGLKRAIRQERDADKSDSAKRKTEKRFPERKTC